MSDAEIDELQKLIGVMHLQDNIYLSDRIDSPFVMGIFRPKIYLPFTLSEQERMEDDWITEWNSVGQPYVALLHDWSSGEMSGLWLAS